jgi:hypothetical protein
MVTGCQAIISTVCLAPCGIHAGLTTKAHQGRHEGTLPAPIFRGRVTGAEVMVTGRHPIVGTRERRSRLREARAELPCNLARAGLLLYLSQLLFPGIVIVRIIGKQVLP